jgi:hypothetical protein
LTLQVGAEASVLAGDAPAVEPAARAHTIPMVDATTEKRRITVIRRRDLLAGWPVWLAAEDPPVPRR